MTSSFLCLLFQFQKITVKVGYDFPSPAVIRNYRITESSSFRQAYKQHFQARFHILWTVCDFTHLTVPSSSSAANRSRKSGWSWRLRCHWPCCCPAGGQNRSMPGRKVNYRFTLDKTLHRSAVTIFDTFLQNCL